MRSRPDSLRHRASAALRDSKLQQALRTSLGSATRSREEAVAEVENWKQLRGHARTVKDHTLARLGTYLTELERQLASRGVEVVWAETAVDAAGAIVAIGRKHEASRVIKSKTMIGEEIELNKALEAAGFEVVESDLGEYIVQLAGEPPSHIVAPALHKSRHDVAALFADRLGSDVGDDPEDLARLARSRLRDRFLKADMGVTGVNFAVAEDGTLVVVENEGNARLTTALPPVHVAVMSLEKVVPRRRDLAVFLKLLTRSATGQRATSYVNLIRGPRAAGETDGPAHQYLVIVDNGRTRMLADPELRSVLRCVRCGACQNVCPVFQRIGGHAYATTYQGPIGVLLTPQLLTPLAAAEHPFASSLCGACSEVCPVEIDIPRLLLRLRGEVVDEKAAARSSSKAEVVGWRLWSRIAASPARLDLAGRMARGMLRLGLARFFPLVSQWRRARELPRIPPASFRRQYQRGRR